MQALIISRGAFDVSINGGNTIRHAEGLNWNVQRGCGNNCRQCELVDREIHPKDVIDVTLSTLAQGASECRTLKLKSRRLAVK